MRALWKGALSFGLVNIPVKMYVATEKKDVRFRYLHRDCMTPIQYRKFCTSCQSEVGQNDIVLGYEYQKGRYVVMEEEDFSRIPHRTTRTVDILDFVDLNRVDPVFFDKSYYLEPVEGGEKAYTLLLQAMQSTGKVAIARIIIRTKESLAAVRSYQDVLVLETMFYPDEIRNPAELTLSPDQINIHDNEMKMAISLIQNLATDFDGARYQNEYRKALWEVIQNKVAGKEVIEATAAPETGKVVDLMEALKASVKLAQEARQPEKPAVH